MHYYAFHIGDYQQDTAHLEPMEDLAYRRMLDLYYKTEAPLPVEVDEVARLIRMRTHSECIALVLREFFECTDDGWFNQRIEDELQRTYAKSEAAKRSAEARWAKQKRKKSQSKQSYNANAMRTQCEADANGMLPITHDPLPTTHTKSIVPAARDKAGEVDQAFDVFWSAGMRKVDKQKSKAAFKRKAGSEPVAFANKLNHDIKTRLRLGQLGFDKMHPTTYLNGERWQDEYPSSSALEINGNSDKEYFQERAKEDPFL